MKRHPRHIAILGACSVALFAAADAGADAQTFVQQEHSRIEHILRQPPSTSRDDQVHRALETFVDFTELTHRAFGEPCPTSEPSCENLWAGYDAGQKEELRSLLEQLVRKTYEHNLKKTLDFDITYHGARDEDGTTHVMTEAKDRTKPREPATRVDYVVKEAPGGPKVVDIVTEGSSLTKNYYDQFRKKMHTATEGYPNIVQKLREKIAKND